MAKILLESAAMKLVLLAVAATGFSSCKISDPLSCQTSDDCNTAERPFCDQWGAFDESNGIANTCIPAQEKVYCESDFAVCLDREAKQCDAGGFAVVTQCPLGCAPSGDRCLNPIPSNISQFAWPDDLPTLAFDQPITIGTFYGEVLLNDEVVMTIPGQLVTHDGNEIFFAFVESATLADVTFAAVFNRPTPIALVSRGDIVINGVMKSWNAVSTEASCGDAWGGGGAAGHGFGGRGGGDRGANLTKYTGTVGTPDLVPLRGGCGPFPGGAIQLFSATKIHVKNGYIDVTGAGGRSQHGQPTGGSSGGAVLLEAPTVEFENGTGITANGGGGGCNPPHDIAPGERGKFSKNPAAGGCRGAGAGGTEDDGEHTETWLVGGAGGGTGRVRINVPSGQFEVPTSALVTPTPSIGTLRTE